MYGMFLDIKTLSHFKVQIQFISINLKIASVPVIQTLKDIIMIQNKSLMCS